MSGFIIRGVTPYVKWEPSMIEEEGNLDVSRIFSFDSPVTDMA